MTVGDTAVNDSWVFYGAPVLAVADATVVAAEDRFADQIPDQARPVTLEEADGNHVVLDLGSGRYAFYAHLEPGSVAVRVGDRVCRGQQLGRLGNSGSSTGPHLHFHVSDGISALDADGLPYAFDAFERTGRIPPLDDLLPLVQAGQPIPVDTAEAGPRTDQLPLGRDVVAFPAAAASC
jgi:murein DD-endopeptidase MepM/ murein hydrolase activator NlpD